MMKIEDMRSTDFQIKAMKNLAEHAYREMKAAAFTLEQEKQKQRSLMLEWAWGQYYQAESYFSGIINALQAAGWMVYIKEDGTAEVSPI